MNVSPNPPRQSSRRSASPWGIAIVVVASAAAHGALLGLPWPFESEPFELSEPVLSELDDSALMEIAVLPRSLLEPEDLEATVADAEAELDVTPQQQTTESESEPEPLLSQEPEPKTDPEPELEPVPKLEPELEPEPEPEPESETDPDPLPVLPENDPDPVGDLPIASGFNTPNEPVIRPLSVRQNDPGEFINTPSARRELDDPIFQNFSGLKPKNVGEFLNITYPLGDKCPSYENAGKPEDGILMLILDKDDNILTSSNGKAEPEMIESTEYPILDELAVQEVKEKIGTSFFDSRENDTAYMMGVSVQGYPDHCPQ